MERAAVEFHGMWTGSEAMAAMFHDVERVARTESTVLIRGETGSGKELVARAIHRLSRRARGPLVAINCATITPELGASELFGHTKGAFTGAVSSHKGVFEQAHGGTIFLDEVAELSLEVQARLLRVLQERIVIPVGGSEQVPVDVRIISATHRGLRGLVEQGRFRADLMYRLRVVPLFLPPLRERGDDVMLLTARILTELRGAGMRAVSGMEPEAERALRAYGWPGNVRELRNALERAVVLGQGELLRAAELPPELREQGGQITLVDEVEEHARIQAALEEVGGSKVLAAELLGMSRTTLWRKLRQHDLER
jgi:two-component system, NtrC family, response regulator AtoC